MKMNFFERTWLSPAVTIEFAVITVTGVLLFFHVKNSTLVTLHNWFGWVLVVTGAVHLVLNWRPLVSYLKRRGGLAALVLSFGLLAALTVAGTKEHQGGAPASPVLMAIDANHDGKLDADEIAKASAALLRLDKNRDGQVTADEMPTRGH